MSRKRNSMKSALRAVAAAAVLGGASVGAMACGTDPYLGQICTFAFSFCPQGWLPADGRQMQISSNQPLYSLLGTMFGGNGTTYFNLPDLRGRVVVGTGQYAGSYQSFVVNLGQKLGQEAVVLTANQAPAHTHPVTFAPNALTGNASLSLSGASISGQTITGSITTQALNGDNPAAGGVNVPTTTANTVGKSGANLQFYPPGTNKIAVPTSHDLAVSGGTVGGNASGTIGLPAAATTINTGANTPASAPVTVLPPSLGMTQCIAVTGMYPMRP
ncbi:phage tail protein [uncultured Azohydromonas sp.]|jgi:Microcystin-dependent protein|uniref:phage tail protein n=1 Tax=uncultured Azohydromonas sp. TaxID=487342 RepID=UPI0026068B09|nr:tail fiber protein [uncultured Azohydromonas sp.]